VIGEIACHVDTYSHNFGFLIGDYNVHWQPKTSILKMLGENIFMRTAITLPLKWVFNDIEPTPRAVVISGACATGSSVR
jgi:hypothetical protein